MSWLCNNCETLNDDNDNICLVCNSVPPSISEISLDCRKSQISWTSSNVNQLTLRYSQGDFNITGFTSTSIDISDVETLVFIAKNDVAERIFPVTLSRSFVQEVLKYKKDDESWIFASRHGTREDIEHYISLYPEGRHIRDANKRLSKIEEDEKAQIAADENDWKTALRLDTVDGYIKYINKHHYPHSNLHWSEAQSAIKKLRDAEDEKKWERACSEDSLEAYKDYISKFPEGNHIVECKSCIDEKAWQHAVSVNTIAAYQAYLKSYKYGKHLPDAKTKIDSLSTKLDDQAWDVARNTDSIESYERYERNHPNGKHLYDCRKKLTILKDVKQWQKARSSNTVLEYKSYLSSFPTGLHAEEARKKIEKLTKKGNSGCLTIIIVLIVAAIMGCIIYVNINDGSHGATFGTDNPGMIHSPSDGASPTPSSNHSISSSEIASIKNSLDSRLPGMEQAKKEGLTPTGIIGAQKQINKLKDANDPSWQSYQSRLDKLK